ncbi:putative major facilitator superfamily, MFS transporter superfamily [Septoria linicola]|nr:putative major facilitator superfamily, MFS transporter superfamily [Septoria linicola]
MPSYVTKDPNTGDHLPGSWRSSTSLVIFTSILGLFTETFLYGFVVPIVAYMFEVRLRQDPAYTQRYISGLLFLAGFVALSSAPIIGHLADKTSNRRTLLLISLAGCTIGTVLLSATPSVWAVFLGRAFQGVAGQGAWIACFTMLTDKVDKKHFGKTLGFASSFVAGGVLVGPATAGTLLEWLGYWTAWSIPFALLAIDLIARLIMVEGPRAKGPSSPGEDSDTVDEGEPNEATRLLPAEIQERSGTIIDDVKDGKAAAAKGFYQIMPTNGIIIVALINLVLLSAIVAALDATFPLHLRNVFGWGPAPVGLIFLCIQIPSMIMGPIVGWLRDHIGLREPTTLGWILLVPTIWMIEIPGSWELSFLDSKSKTEVAFVGCVTAFGVVSPLVRGAGTVQMTVTLSELEDRYPGTFGPHGGSSRMFSLAGIAFNVGLMVGPLLGGALADTFGFYYMMCALAALCIVAAILSSAFFTDKRSVPFEAEGTSA